MITHNWLTPDWPARPNIHALTTLRTNGVSLPPYDSFNLAMHVGDNPRHVEQNRAHLRDMLQLPNEPFWLNQIHSTIAVKAHATPTTPDADASYTDKPGIVCAVLSGDCLPLLVTDESGSIVCAIHAGWRGLAAGVIENAICALPVAATHLLVWLGPALGPDIFEVGPEVVEQFTEFDPMAHTAFTPTQGERETYMGNFFTLAKQRLHNLGVTHIYGGTHCTYTETDLFYSYRRNNRTGRMASIIWMEKP